MLTGALLSLALAFGSPGDFAAPATLGGGGGVRFTGSPNAKWNCSVCHDAPADTRAGPRLTTMGRDLPAQGYQPGETYELELATSEGAEGRNAFALELVDLENNPAGVLTPAPLLAGTAAEPYLCAGVDPVVVSEGVAQSYSCAVKRWRFRWTAPAVDVGSVRLFASVVDANADSRNSGDVTHSLVLGIPSPSSLAARSSGCSSAPALLGLVAALGWFFRRRGARALLLGLALISAGVAQAAPKKKKKTPVTRPVAPAPEPPPEAEPTQPEPGPAAVTPAAVRPAPEPAPVVVQPAPAAPPRVVEAPKDTSHLPGGLELTAQLGGGFRSLALDSTSYPTPYRQAFGYPSLAFGLTVYPTRLMRSPLLTGLHLQANYAVGWVLVPPPLGAALVLPSDGRASLGYSVRAGPLELVPRAVYRVVVGGVERNAFFDDGYFQSLGGELGVGLVAGRLSLQLTPRVGALVDVGTLMVKSYGTLLGGLTFGGSAKVGFELAAGVQLSASYQLTVTRADFAGRGERALEALSLRDQVHAGYLVLGLER